MTPPLEEKLKELLQFAKEHSLAEVSWQEGEQKVFFRRNMDEVESSTPVSVEEDASDVIPEVEESIVKSTMVGTFRRSEGKGRPPFVMEGNHIKPGDRVGLVECMKIPNDVTSFCEGMIKKVLVEDGQPVEYGQALFVVSPSGTNGTQK